MDIVVYNPMHGMTYFTHLRYAYKLAAHYQREDYRNGVISHTTIITDNATYSMGLHFGDYKESTFYHRDISVRLSNILTRKSCRTIAQAVALGAGINSGFVNPYKIRNMGKSTIDELHRFSRLHVCDIVTTRKVKNDRYFLGYVMEG